MSSQTSMEGNRNVSFNLNVSWKRKQWWPDNVRHNSSECVHVNSTLLQCML
jgi:hypothetical protein